VPPALRALTNRGAFARAPRRHTLAGTMRACLAPGGDAWLAFRRSAVFGVPSAIVPESRNLLLNVAHPDAARARIASIRPLAFDERLRRPGDET